MRQTTFDLIKKQNGENFAKTIRKFDNGIFDIPNLPDIVKYAGRSVDPILPYLISLKNIKINDSIPCHESPEELLKKAGYDAYYADTLEKQNAISKYFSPGEELCTFKDTNRYKNYHIINAIKKNADLIERYTFDTPSREDEYATSVISIQILKSGGFISIKNRYNHTLENPDNTFNSNPDNIIPGLSAALKKRFGVDFSSQKVRLPNGYILNNQHIIRYRSEHNNIYIGHDFYLKDEKIIELNHDYQHVIEGMFILDLKNRCFLNPANFKDPFVDIMNAEIKDKKIRLSRDKNNNRILFADQIPLIKLNEKGYILSLHLPKTGLIDKFFLYRGGNKMKLFSAPQLKQIKSGFLYHNTELITFFAPKLEQIEDDFLFKNRLIENLNISNIVQIGNNFLHDNETLSRFGAPLLKTIGTAFLYSNKALKKFYAPKLETVHDDFMFFNEHIRHFFAKHLKSIGNQFLPMNNELRIFRTPHLKKIGKTFLISNKKLNRLIAPKLENVEEDSLENHHKKQYLLTHRFDLSVSKKRKPPYMDRIQKFVKQVILKMKHQNQKG